MSVGVIMLVTNPMRILSSCLAVLVFGVAPISASPDEDSRIEAPVKYLRTVAKLGSPNLLGLELEGIPPGIGNWLGIWMGFTYLPIATFTSTSDGWETEKARGGFNHIGAGVNLYPTGEAKGLYASFGYDRVSNWVDVIITETGQEDFSNPTHMASLQLGYKVVKRIFTFSFYGGYGFNFGYEAPVVHQDQTILFKKGNWIQAGGSFGLSFPFARRR
jgi:hypothetical protein